MLALIRQFPPDVNLLDRVRLSPMRRTYLTLAKEGKYATF